MARFDLHGGDLLDAARGAELLRRRGAADKVQVLLVHPDGTQEAVPVPDAVAGVIGAFLEQVSAAEGAAPIAEDTEVSPEEAAAILDTPRPLLRRRMDAGALPFRRTGTDFRLRLADVLALKRREAGTRAALAELRADTDDLMARGL